MKAVIKHAVSRNKMSVIPIPTYISDITPSWIHLVTGHHPIPKTVTLEGDIQAGIGFLSSICRVSYQTESGENQSIVVKLLPTNPKWLEFALSDCSDEREIQFYSVVAPDLVEMVPSLRDNVCLYYNGQVRPADTTKNIPRASLLVLEDLKAKGFQMMNFSGDGTPHVLQSLVKYMARLHYAAQAISVKKAKSLPELYPFMQGITDNEEWHNQIESLSEEGFSQLEKMLKNQHVPESVWKRYEKLKPFTRKFVEKVEHSGRQIPCLIHGDAWPPNIMVHENLPVKILDWQLLGYRDVTFDLSILLYTVLPKEQLNKTILRDLVWQYWQEFEDLCKSGQYAEQIRRRNWEEFEQYFFTWAAAFGFVVFLPSIECYEKDWPKYANILKFLCEELNLPEFLLGIC